jgi:hypothetical protein
VRAALPSFERSVQPVLITACAPCHNDKITSGGLNLGMEKEEHAEKKLTRLLCSDRLGDDCRDQTIDADAFVFGLFRQL